MHEAARKKQLGQFFTGQRVGRLLAALARAETSRTIIDPMAGSADLLVACLAVGATPTRLVGVEIDANALAQADAALAAAQGAELILADAFCAGLPSDQFDLVITNPPYIRYQSKRQVDGVRVPTSKEVRAGLLRAIADRADVGDNARSQLLRAARRYPDTSDIAVPAWILSASMVREGGTLAVVAPQAWLSRNYAQAVRELLDDAFDVEVIVEDGDASWFEEAQVRTQLVVAHRRSARSSPVGRRSVRIARATRQLESNGHLVGAMDSEAAVAASLRRVEATHQVQVTRGLTAHVEHEFSVAAAGKTGHVPTRVASVLHVSATDIATRSLDSYGWRVGQGLRTGANEFFYVDYAEDVARPSARWHQNSLAIPSECLLPAVRRQSDLPREIAVRPNYPLKSRVVYLRGWVTAEDLRRMDGSHDVRVLPDDVAAWIAQVAESPFSRHDPTQLFPDLTAVAPNRRADSSGRPIGFWYQLPELAPRHRPSLFVARVCGGRPITYANPARAVIDANFATLWPVEMDALPPEALLALLHSSWVWANLEATCTVLGGGALKVEATDLRRLALPDLTADEIGQLVVLGRALLTCQSEASARAVDAAVASFLVANPGEPSEGSGLRAFAETALERRSQRKT